MNKDRALLWFANEQAEVLAENSHKSGWDDPNKIVYFLRRLHEEVDELESAVLGSASTDTVIREAADVANFAMFIANVARREA